MLHFRFINKITLKPAAWLQGHLAQRKTPPSKTLQLAHA